MKSSPLRHLPLILFVAGIIMLLNGYSHLPKAHRETDWAWIPELKVGSCVRLPVKERSGTLVLRIQGIDKSQRSYMTVIENILNEGDDGRALIPATDLERGESIPSDCPPFKVPFEDSKQII